MMRLFGMECKKIAGSILYWVLVLALLAVTLFQYDPSVESELRRTNDPSSVFYTADSYAPERGAPDEAMEQNMMKEATKLLMYNYRDNCYLYYPFGYVKEKAMSAKEQAVILQYLMELTGLSEQALNGTVNHTADDTDNTSDTGDIPISGGAFVLKPGEGSMNESGQFVAEPEDWQYVPGEETAPETSSQSSNDFEIQVTFERFKEIMEEVNGMIGPGSYFSWPMLKLYYFGNDMEDAPITERQHREFYEGDRVTGAFARYYCDSISISVLFLPAFVIVDLMLRDKRRNMRGLIYPEGRHISTDDTHVAIISQDLAERNELKIGDYLTAHSYSVEDQGFTGQEIKVQIIGLFTPNAVEQFGETVTTYDKIQNRVFVDLQTSKELDGGEINYGFSALHVTITDPQDMARVVAEVKALPGIDWKAFTVEVDNETYENAAAPLATLNELVVTLLVVIIVVSAIILALILTLWTKTRIHEIGVFLSVGIMKSAIIGQYLIEVLLIAVLAFGLSYFTSNAIAGQIGNHLLEQSMQAEPEDDNDVVAAAAAVDVGADNLIQKPLPTENGIQVSIGLDNLTQLYLIGLAIIIVAVSASSITVMRLKPREILSKMS